MHRSSVLFFHCTATPHIYTYCHTLSLLDPLPIFYSLTTPKGVKVSIMLEETGLPYEAHLVDFGTDDQKTPEFLSLNPNGKIPAILDPAGPGGKPLALFESGAILLYLADKTGTFENGRASRRERVCPYESITVVAVSLKKKT